MPVYAVYGREEGTQHTHIFQASPLVSSDGRYILSPIIMPFCRVQLTQSDTTEEHKVTHTCQLEGRHLIITPVSDTTRVYPPSSVVRARRGAMRLRGSRVPLAWVHLRSQANSTYLRLMFTTTNNINQLIALVKTIRSLYLQPLLSESIIYVSCKFDSTAAMIDWVKQHTRNVVTGPAKDS
jgi:hypothetical protein